MAMQAKYVNTLRECQMSLIKDLNVESTMGFLIAAKVMVPGDADVVNAKPKHSDRTRQVLNLIEKRGDAAFEALLEMLRDKDCGNTHLLQLVEEKLQSQSSVTLQCSDVPDAHLGALQPTSTSQTSGYDFAETCSVRPQQPNKQVTEQQLGKLASKLGKDWEKLANQLGMSPSEIYYIKEENKHNVWGQVYGMLVKWKQRQYKDATVGSLVKALEVCEIGQEVYSFLAKE